MKATEYLFTYLDKEGNILIQKIRTCSSKKHSLTLAKQILKTSPFEVWKIKTRKLLIKDII